MKKSKTTTPTSTEFIDENGNKWIQTSTEDIFALKELNDVLSLIEKEKNPNEMVLARIDFQKVNKEYYEIAIELQNKLKNQTALLKKVIDESKRILDKKNEKLKELIEYIRKLHIYFSYLKANNDNFENIKIPEEILQEDWSKCYPLQDINPPQKFQSATPVGTDEDDLPTVSRILKADRDEITGIRQGPKEEIDKKLLEDILEHHEFKEIKLDEIKLNDDFIISEIKLNDVVIHDTKQQAKKMGSETESVKKDSSTDMTDDDSFHPIGLEDIQIDTSEFQKSKSFKTAKVPSDQIKTASPPKKSPDENTDEMKPIDNDAGLEEISL